MFMTRLCLMDEAQPDYWTVAAPLIWLGDTVTITVPIGFRTDLASIPRVLRNLPTLDPDGLSRRPAVLHDFLYATQPCTRDEADCLLRAALLSEGTTKFAAWMFYKGVHWGGGAPWRRYTLGLPQK